MTPARFERLRATLDKRQPDLTVLADEVHKGQNLSAIIRTCDAVGIHRIHTVKPRLGYRRYDGTARGSHRWVEVEVHPNVEQAITTVRTAGMKIYAATFSERAVDYRSLDYTGPVAVLLGAERTGVSATAAAAADAHIVIPMMGMVESYNVSVAAAIILAEAQRQRQQAGLYDRVRLDPATYEETFFRWAHPKVAAFCRQRGLPYPPLREDGEIAEPAAWYRRLRQAD